MNAKTFNFTMTLTGAVSPEFEPGPGCMTREELEENLRRAVQHLLDIGAITMDSESVLESYDVTVTVEEAE